ncbi:hypothetical protein L1887_19567 [Cichorium endivia]|nr:hypothetical protein L1887_19567 [Cichorium endivia]
MNFAFLFILSIKMLIATNVDLIVSNCLPAWPPRSTHSRQPFTITLPPFPLLKQGRVCDSNQICFVLTVYEINKDAVHGARFARNDLFVGRHGFSWLEIVCNYEDLVHSYCYGRFLGAT